MSRSPLSRASVVASDRVLARLATGSLAHLVAGLIDWAQLLGRVGWARVRRRPVRW